MLDQVLVADLRIRKSAVAGKISRAEEEEDAELAIKGQLSKGGLLVPS